jgi:hypothetical protein
MYRLCVVLFADEDVVLIRSRIYTRRNGLCVAISKSGGQDRRRQDHECSACNVAAADNVINDSDQIFFGPDFQLSVRGEANASGCMIAHVLWY